jgi:hypothetical protein
LKLATEKRDAVLIAATEIVKEALQTGTAQLSAADVSTLVAVTVRDIVQVCHEDEARLTKVELQTQVLGAAILAMNDSVEGLAPAVQAVKAEMSKDQKGAPALP